MFFRVHPNVSEKTPQRFNQNATANQSKRRGDSTKAPRRFNQSAAAFHLIRRGVWESSPRRLDQQLQRHKKTEDGLTSILCRFRKAKILIN